MLHDYGEECHSRRISRAVVDARRRRPIRRTLQLADLVSSAVPPAARRGRIHPATRTFQAIRIAVNGELDELAGGLEAGLRCLAPGGRLVVIAFHSLEDRLVKRFVRKHMELPFRKPIRPGGAECARNPRARSARLRCGIRRAS